MTIKPTLRRTTNENLSVNKNGRNLEKSKNVNNSLVS